MSALAWPEWKTSKMPSAYTRTGLSAERRNARGYQTENNGHHSRERRKECEGEDLRCCFTFIRTLMARSLKSYDRFICDDEIIS